MDRILHTALLSRAALILVMASGVLFSGLQGSGFAETACGTIPLTGEWRKAGFKDDALRAVRGLVPEMPEVSVTNLMGPVHATVTRNRRFIQVYRIAENEFLHVATSPDYGVMGVEHRRYEETSGRMVSQVLTGTVERLESSELVFGDWSTTTNGYVQGQKRRGIGKQVELHLAGLDRDRLIHLLGAPARSDSRSLTYFFEFNAGMVIWLSPEGKVERVAHTGR